MIAGLIWSGWRLANLGRCEAFVQALREPQQTQEALLKRLVRRHAASSFGREHGFERIQSPADFRTRIPVQSWSEVAPVLIGARIGTPTALSTDPLLRLIPTSGSSAERKLIPWTAGLATGFANALAPWLEDVFRRFPATRSGPAYWCITPPEDPAAGEGVGFDTDRSYLGGRWQRLLGRTMAVPDGILAAPDPLTATVLHLLRCRDLRLVSVWHPSFLTLLLDRLTADFPALLSQLASGDQSIGLVAAPQRAAELAAMDPTDLRRLWPALALVSAWADGPAHLPANDLRQRLGLVPFQAKGLLATEGVVTIPYAGTHPLALNSQVYEFVDDHGRCRWSHELAIGGEYEIIGSNGGGLWRYRLGDRVRVVGLLGRTPCLTFLGRIGMVDDLAGEKLDEAIAARVLAELLPGAGFAALQPEPAFRRWRLVLDMATPAGADLAERLDARLHRIEHWRIARRLGQLAPPVVVRVALTGAGLLAVLAARKRQRLGEFKPPVLLAADALAGLDLAPWPDADHATG